MRILKFVFYIILISYLPLGGAYSQTEKNLTNEQKRVFDFFFYEAMNARTQENYAAAFDYLQHCYSIDSTNAAVLYELGNFYSSVEDKRKGLEMYREATLYSPGNYYYGTAYGTICLEFEKYDTAIEQYSLLAEKYPERTNLYLYLAESYKQNKNYAKALDALNSLEKIIGLNEQISLQKFQFYRQLNQEKNAFAEIQKYIDKYPTEIKYYILLGDLYMHADKNDEAIRVYSKAKSIDPDDPYLISSMSNYYDKIGKKEQAEEEIKIALISHNMDVPTKLAILAQHVNTLQQRYQDTKEANALFDTLMVQHPQEPSLNLMYGNLLAIQEKKEEARAQYRIYAEANPSNPLGWEQMLFTAYPDSLDMAIDICQTAINHIPEEPQFYFFLGLAQYLKENYADALKSLNTGVQYVPKGNIRLLSDFYGQIGDLYYHTEQVDSSFIAYEKAILANPNNLGVLNNYSYYLSLQKKDLDKAERLSGITIKAEPLNPTFLDTYGWILFMQKAYTMAKIYIENAIKHSEEKEEEVSGEVYEHYGDVLYMTGEKEEALEYWKKAKEKGKVKSEEILDKKIETKEYIEK